ERRHLDLRAQRRLRQADRQLAVEVIAIALEDRVLANAHLDVEIAGLGAGRSGLAFTRQADAVAVVHAGGNLDLQGFLTLDAAVPVAVLAGIDDVASAAAAGRAHLLHREDALLHPHP